MGTWQLEKTYLSGQSAPKNYNENIMISVPPSHAPFFCMPSYLSSHKLLSGVTAFMGLEGDLVRLWTASYVVGFKTQGWPVWKVLGRHLFLSGQSRGVYFWLCVSQGHHRVASSGFELKTKVLLVVLLVPSGLLAALPRQKQMTSQQKGVQKRRAYGLDWMSITSLQVD